RRPVAHRPRLRGRIRQTGGHRNRLEVNAVVIDLMDDAALIAVELRGPCRRALSRADQLLIAIDSVSDALLLFVGQKEITAVLEAFGGISAGDDHRRAEDLRVAAETE